MPPPLLLAVRLTRDFCRRLERLHEIRHGHVCHVLRLFDDDRVGFASRRALHGLAFGVHGDAIDVVEGNCRLVWLGFGLLSTRMIFLD